MPEIERGWQANVAVYGADKVWKQLNRDSRFAGAVAENEKRFVQAFADSLVVEMDSRPLLCTWVGCRIGTTAPGVVLYEPRDLPRGSIVCHLGEAHLGHEAKGDILELLERLPS